jgi:hypothetical protein
MLALFFFFFFFPPMIDRYPLNDLAGFLLHTEYEIRGKFKKSFYILGYLLELIIKIWQFGFIFFLSKSDTFGPFFIPWKILFVKIKIMFFRSKICNFSPQKTLLMGITRK